jgi:diguanylate cyclase
MKERNPIRDRMTGLKTRFYLLGILEGILGHNGQVVLMLLSVDGSRCFNDGFKKRKGEKEIIKITQEIEMFCESPSLVFRWDYDQFGIILYESSLDNAREITMRIQAQREPVVLVVQGVELKTRTLFVEIAHIPDQASDVESLIDAAERALFKAQNDGKFKDGAPSTGHNRIVAAGDFLEDSTESHES